MPPRLTTPRRLSPSAIYTNNLKTRLRSRDASPIFSSAFFSTTTRYHARSHEPTYYEILNVPVTATAAEIKKYTPNPIPSTLYSMLTQLLLRIDNSTPSPSNTTQTATAPIPKQPNTSPQSHPPTTSSATATNAHATISIMAFPPIPRERIHIPWAATAVPAQHMPDPGQRAD